jgi:hypothetical protein
LYSSATGSIASATGLPVGSDGDVDLVVGKSRGQCGLADVGLALVSPSRITTSLRPATVIVPPCGVFQAPWLNPVIV